MKLIAIFAARFYLNLSGLFLAMAEVASWCSRRAVKGAKWATGRVDQWVEVLEE